VKLGQFELDFGHQHRMRSDNAQVGDNRLVGNPVVDAAAVQTGLELSGRGPWVGWSLAATNGTGEFGLTGPMDRFANGRGWGLTGKLQTSPWKGVLLAVSGYVSDQSSGPAAENLFAGNAGQIAGVYQNLLLGPAATPTLGTGGDVAAFQGDLEYRPFPGTRLLGFFGHMQDDASAVHSWNYGSFEIAHRLAPSWYVAARYSGALDRRRENTRDYEKYQFGTGYRPLERILAKLEWVDQDNRKGTRDSFEGLVGEVSVSF